MADQGEHILPVHFFKIILRTNLQRIKLPLDFTDIYGNGWSNPVFINPPDGTEWEVYWSKENDEVWFEQGWKEFTENYSLEHGCMVVFKYDGASKFGAVILDKDTVEIEYASDDENGNLNESDEESAEVSIPDDKNDEFSNFDDEWPDQSEQMRGESSAQRTSSLNRPKEARAKNVAEAFISNNPFITLFIKPRDLGIHNLVGYVENKAKDVMLHVGERSWEVKMLCSNEPPNLRRTFSVGWNLFTKENELQPGDVCVFELINSEDPVAFKVHHVHKHYSVNTSQRISSMNRPKGAKAKKVAEAFISNNPFCTVTIKPYDLVTNRRLIHRLEGYVENKDQDVMLHVGERFWKVKMVCYDKPHISHRLFSAGWNLFVKENQLQPRDVCVFELINNEDPVAFKVHVYKDNQ